MPLLEEVSGFIAYYSIEAGEGTMASLSVFEDKAGADEFVTLAHQWVEDNAARSSQTRRLPRDCGRERHEAIRTVVLGPSSTIESHPSTSPSSWATRSHRSPERAHGAQPRRPRRRVLGRPAMARKISLKPGSVSS